MAKRKRAIPQYGTVVLNGIEYYRTRVEDSDGNRVALYAKTPEKLYDKELEALEQIDSTTFRRRSPTVAEYCEKWLLMQSVHVRATVGLSNILDREGGENLSGSSPMKRTHGTGVAPTLVGS